MAGVRGRGGPGVQEAVDPVNRAVRGEWFDFRAMSKGRFGSIPNSEAIAGSADSSSL
jgi:hypothetical protein